MVTEVRGIVVRSTDIKETDRLLTIYTDTMGTVTALAKGSRSLKSRKMSSTQQFCYSSFVLSGIGDKLYVKESELLSEMKAKAITTVIAISRNLKSTNSAEAIAEQFLKSADANVAALGKELKSLSGGSSKKALATLGAEISKASADDASFTADEINAYLQNSGVRSDDAVYRLFGNLIIAVKADHSKAKSEFESAGSDLSTAVIEQNVNKSTVNSVINKLCNLFGITESDITETAPDVDVDLRDPSDAPPTPDDSEVEEPDVDISSGGLGTGDVIYGSNDLVFDPYTNTYRPYGEILNDYFAKANEQITDGKTSDEVSDAAEEYFGALFGGSN